ncbi:MAG: proC [Planctomycetaceae bacterium]|nr:proC [Planctomycetaceae bacterium]
MSTRHIGFIGAGKMATALAKGFISAGCCTAEHIIASDVVPAAREYFTAETHAPGVIANADVVSHSEILFLAVKPQNMAAVLAELKPLLTPEHLVISIAAGITLATLEAGLGSGRRVIRVMPNTPCLVNASASGYALGSAATAEDAQTVERLLSSVGLAFKVQEHLLNAVTGLSGSGPAFVYLMIEALSDGGVRMGLPRDVAMRLAAQTLLGSAKMVLETGLHPGELKDAVTSPGGTTIAGLHALERGGLRASLMNAVEAATLRAIELGKSS